MLGSERGERALFFSFGSHVARKEKSVRERGKEEREGSILISQLALASP
jgi:hypothetical protein